MLTVDMCQSRSSVTQSNNAALFALTCNAGDTQTSLHWSNVSYCKNYCSLTVYKQARTKHCRPLFIDKKGGCWARIRKLTEFTFLNYGSRKEEGETQEVRESKIRTSAVPIMNWALIIYVIQKALLKIMWTCFVHVKPSSCAFLGYIHGWNTKLCLKFKHSGGNLR